MKMAEYGGKLVHLLKRYKDTLHAISIASPLLPVGAVHDVESQMA